jgi:hypothetical protein
MPARLRKGLLLAFAALIAVVVGAFWRHGGNEPASGAKTNRPVSGAESVSDTDVSPVAVLAERSTLSAACDGQTLELTLNDTRTTPCFSSVSTTQNGSVRSYELQTASGATRSLRIDASGAVVVAVFLKTDSTPLLRCKAENCKGVTIGKRNAEGLRTISLRQTVLTEAAGGSAALTGNINTPADHRTTGIACDDQGISLIAADGSITPFCAQGGVGFEIGDDGTTTYRFTNLDNESLLVVMNPSRQVQRVAFEGESSFACRGGECRQLQIDGEREFNFSGTTLIDIQSGDRSVVLNGTLIVPPL